MLNKQGPCLHGTYNLGEGAGMININIKCLVGYFHIHINVEVVEATSNKEDNFEDVRVCKSLRDFHLERAENNQSNQWECHWKMLLLGRKGRSHIEEVLCYEF